MWNRLIALPINDRKRMEIEGEGTTAKEENVVREGVVFRGGYYS